MGQPIPFHLPASSGQVIGPRLLSLRTPATNTLRRPCGTPPCVRLSNNFQLTSYADFPVLSLNEASMSKIWRKNSPCSWTKPATLSSSQHTGRFAAIQRMVASKGVARWSRHPRRSPCTLKGWHGGPLVKKSMSGCGWFRNSSSVQSRYIRSCCHRCWQSRRAAASLSTANTGCTLPSKPSSSKACSSEHQPLQVLATRIRVDVLWHLLGRASAAMSTDAWVCEGPASETNT